MQKILDTSVIGIILKKEFEYPELITWKESYKTSIFFAIIKGKIILVKSIY